MGRRTIPLRSALDAFTDLEIDAEDGIMNSARGFRHRRHVMLFKTPPLCLRAFLCLSVCFTAWVVFGHGDLASRLQDVDQQLQSQPGNIALHIHRGDLLQESGRSRDAAAEFQSALARDPRAQMARKGLAETFTALGRWAEARFQVDQCLRANSNNYPALLLSSRIYAASGLTNLAIQDISRAIAVGRDVLPEVYLERARLEVAMGRFDQAVSGLDAGARRLSFTPPLVERAIEIEESQGKFGEALTRLNELIERAPRREFLLQRKGRILERASRPGQALSAYQAGLRELGMLLPERRGVPAVQALAAELQTDCARLTSSGEGKAIEE